MPSATICTSVITTRDDDDGHDQRERDGAAWIAGFAGRHRNDFVAAEREDQQQPGRRELREATATRLRHEPRRIDAEQPDDDEIDERQQLADRQHVDDEAALADAADVDRGDRDDDER